jgi:DNA-binding YbaB/EbfC family protein
VAAPGELEKADGRKRRAVYNTLGVTVWAAKAEGDPIKIVLASVQRSGRRRGLSPRQNVNKMMQQVQQMQQQMQQAQEELARETVTASAGGGAVKATMTGGLELVSIEIDPDVVDPEDVEMLQDMVLAAVNEALTSAQELASKKLGGITGGLGDLGLNLPGM